MPFFLTDDGFANSKEVMSIPRRNRCAAAGLHRMAGSWCAKELTDGFVPDHMITEFAGTKAMANHLVDAGLWARVKGGYQFTDWAETRQPMRVVVEAERAAARDRMARKRAAAKGLRWEDVRPNTGRTDAEDFDDWHAAEPPPDLGRSSAEPRPTTTLDTVAEATSQVDEGIDANVRANFAGSSETPTQPSHTNTGGDIGGDRYVSSPRATSNDAPNRHHPEHPNGWVDGCPECLVLADGVVDHTAAAVVEARAPEETEPPKYCPEHPDGTPVKCYPCGAARRKHAAWITARDARRAAEQAIVDAAHAEAEIERRERLAEQIAEQQAAELADIEACGLCDDDGMQGPHPCDHHTDQIATNDRGVAAAHAALRNRKRRFTIVPPIPPTPEDPPQEYAAHA